MRFNFIIFVLTVGCGSVMAQQYVVRSGLDPRTQGRSYNELRLCSQTAFPGAPDPKDPCVVTVYSTTETESRLGSTKADAITECKQSIDAAKAALATDINKLPAAAVEALKAQVKEELKAEVLKELIDEIKSGRLKVQSAPASGAKQN